MLSKTVVFLQSHREEEMIILYLTGRPHIRPTTYLSILLPFLPFSVSMNTNTHHSAGSSSMKEIHYTWRFLMFRYCFHFGQNQQENFSFWASNQSKGRKGSKWLVLPVAKHIWMPCYLKPQTVGEWYYLLPSSISVYIHARSIEYDSLKESCQIKQPPKMNI